MVHNEAMAATKTTVRQSVSLPSSIAKQVKTMAKNRRLSSNRMLVELVEDGLEAQRRRQEEFFALAEQFRAASNPADVERLGDKLGRMVFGG